MIRATADFVFCSHPDPNSLANLWSSSASMPRRDLWPLPHRMDRVELRVILHEARRWSRAKGDVCRATKPQVISFMWYPGCKKSSLTVSNSMFFCYYLNPMELMTEYDWIWWYRLMVLMCCYLIAWLWCIVIPSVHRISQLTNDEATHHAATMGSKNVRCFFQWPPQPKRQQIVRKHLGVMECFVERLWCDGLWEKDPLLNIEGSHETNQQFGRHEKDPRWYFSGSGSHWTSNARGGGIRSRFRFIFTALPLITWITVRHHLNCPNEEYGC